MADELEDKVAELDTAVTGLKADLETVSNSVQEIFDQLEVMADLLQSGGLRITGDADITGDLGVGGTISGTLANATVDGDVLADNAVTAVKIRDGVVGTAELANDAVTAAKIGNNQVGNSELAANAVTAAKIKDGEITTNELADNAVTAAKIRDGQVGTNELADNAVNAAKIRNGEVGASELANNAVVAAKIRDRQVTNTKLSNRALERISHPTGSSHVMIKTPGFFHVEAKEMHFGTGVSGNLLGNAFLTEEGNDLVINRLGHFGEIKIRGLASASSASWKTEIADLSLADAEQLVDQLRPRRYRARRDDEREPRLGFIAEETPSPLSTSEKDALYLDGILSALVAVVKDLRRQLGEIRG